MTKPPEDDSKFEPASLMLENESTWFYAAIVSVLCVIILIVAGVTYAWIEVGNATVFANRIDSLYKLAVLGGALVTFCTVAWRGLVSIRQAKAQVDATKNQTDQLVLSREQMESTERNELAKLFQKGVELINGEKASERSAGISTLEVVAFTRKNFAPQSLDQIADGYQFAGEEDYHSDESGYYRDSINVIHSETGYVANRELEFTIHDRKVWRKTPGVRIIYCNGGALRGRRKALLDKDFSNCRFKRTEIINFTVEVDYPQYDECEFRNCKVLKYDPMIATATFNNCNFSDCEIENFYDTLELGEKNFYFDGNPPFTRDEEGISSEWISANLIARPPVESEPAAEQVK